MAVTSVRQLTARGGAFQERNARGYQIRYIVETSSKLDSVNTILTDARLPQVGDAYFGNDRFDFGVRVVRQNARHIGGDPKLWYVDIQYANVQEEDPSEPWEVQPSDRIPRISWRFDRVMLPVWGDFNDGAPGDLDGDKPMTNSKGQPFSPPIQYEVTMPVLQVRAWDTNLRTAELADNTDVVNSTTYGGLPDRTLKLNITGVEEIFVEGRRYWEKHYELAYNRRTWDRYVLDYGYFPDPATGDIRLFLIDSGGNITTETTNANYLQKRVYREADFSTFRFIDRYVTLLGAI